MENLTKMLALKIRESGMQITNIARKSGISRPNLYKILNNQTENVGIETATEICKAIGIDISELTGDFRKGVKIPVLGTVPAGIPLEAIEEILEYEEISPELAKSGEYFGLKDKGDSMAPNILEGDILIIRKQEDANTGDICVVMVNGDDATVKKIKKDPKGLTLIPNNPAYDIVFYSNDEIESLPVRVIGKAVEIRRSL